MMKKLTFCLLLILPCFSLAQKVQSLSKLQTIATQFLEQQIQGKVSGRIEIKPGLIDNRLQLPHCPEQHIEAFLASHAQNIEQTNVVGVRCTIDSKWSLFVPVDVNIYTQLTVLKHAVSKGYIIQSQDLRVIEYDATSLHQGFFQNPQLVAGKAAKRNLNANRPLLHTDLVIPDIIHKGDSVQLIAQSGRLKIQTQGTALDSGAFGETINVRNNRSKKVLQATVVGQKRVKVTI